MKKKKTTLITSLIISSFFSMSAQANMGVWDTTEIRFPIIKNKEEDFISYRVFHRSFLTLDKSGIDSMVLRTGPILKVNDNLSIALHGALIGSNKVGNTFFQEKRVELEPNLDFTIGDLKVGDRNRFELRITEKYDFRYRNMLTIAYNNKLQVIPYISDEIFLSFSDNFSNRFTIGASINLSKNLKLNLGCMNISQINTKKEWDNTPTLIINLLSDLTK